MGAQIIKEEAPGPYGFLAEGDSLHEFPLPQLTQKVESPFKGGSTLTEANQADSWIWFMDRSIYYEQGVPETGHLVHATEIVALILALENNPNEEKIVIF